MDFIKFSWIDYTLFTLMFGISSAVGIYFGCFGKQQTTADYLLGGKKMKVFPVSMSLVASSLSGVSLLGIPTEIYIHGTQYSMLSLSLLVMGFINNFVYLPVFYKLQLTSAFEYFRLRFDKRIKIMASILYTLANTMLLPVIIYAPALAFNQVTGFNLHIIVPVMSLICIFYTTIGGLKAVVWADTLQFSVTLCTLGCILVMGTLSVGGIGTIWEKSKLGNRLEFFNMDPDPTIRTTFWTVVIGHTFSWTATYAAEPATIQRSMSVPTMKDAQKCSIIFVILTIITKIICCFCGLIMYAKYYDCDPLSAGYMKKSDQILPYYVLEVASAIPGLSGLFVAGLFSTALSTLSTYLNTLAGLFYTDFISPFLPANTSEKSASSILKIITVVLGVVSICLIYVVERMGSILEMLLSIKGMTSGPILGLFTLGMVFPFANQKGALCGGIGSILLMCLVVIKNRIHLWNGTIRYAAKPLYTYGCNLTTALPLLLNETYSATTIFSTDSPSEEPFWLYRISVHYYFVMGCIVTLMIALPVSWATRNTQDLGVNPDLFSPFVQRFLNTSAATTRYQSVEKELQEFGINNSDIELKEPAFDKLLKKEFVK